MVLGRFDPFGASDGLLAEAFYEGETPREVDRFRRFLLAPLGATSAAYFAAIAAVVRGPFRRREPWAFWTVLGSAWLWFVVDSAGSLARGAAFNVLVVNLPCIAVLSLPLAMLWPAFRCAAPARSAEAFAAKPPSRSRPHGPE